MRLSTARARRSPDGYSRGFRSGARSAKSRRIGLSSTRASGMPCDGRWRARARSIWIWWVRSRSAARVLDRRCRRGDRRQRHGHGAACPPRRCGPRRARACDPGLGGARGVAESRDGLPGGAGRCAANPRPVHHRDAPAGCIAEADLCVKRTMEITQGLYENVDLGENTDGMGGLAKIDARPEDRRGRRWGGATRP